MRVVLATLRTAIADTLANRGSFAFQVTLMIVNDVAWIVFWGLFFNRTGNVRGWSFQDIIVLFSIMLTAGGLALGLLHNSRKIGNFAAESAFDETLVLPVSPLAYTLTRRVEATNIGDLIFGPALFFVAGHPTPLRAALFIGGTLLGTAVLVSFLVLCGSLTFFVGGRGEQAELGFNALLIFASYPLDFFGGITKLLLFTVVPAAFVTGLPARLVQHFDLPTALALLAVAVAFTLASRSVFALGLRRYSSGSLWVR